MFLKQLIEDITFEDIEYSYENDRYFSYLRNRYSLTDADENNFELLLESDAACDRYSLEMLTVEKRGLLPEVKFVDHEDEYSPLSSRDKKFEELVGCAVDSVWTEKESRGLILITVLLLQQTYYKQLDEKTSVNTDLSKLGGVELIGEMILDDLDKLEEIRQAEMGNRLGR